MKKNQLSLFTALSIVVGCVIGSGVFVKPGKVLLATGESSTAILAWVLGGLLTLAGGLTVAEIASRIPKTGGLYVFMEEIYGKRWGFVSGWVQALIYGPGLMSALALYFGSLFTNFFGMDPTQAKGVAFIALFLLAGVSAWGTSYSAWIQNISTVIKLIPIALIGVAGLFMGHEPIFNQTLTDPSLKAVGLGSAILATLWAYDGWMQVANVAGDIKNPAKNLPRAIVGGLAAVMLVYVCVNMSLFHVLPKDQIALLNEKSAGAASEILFGSLGGKLISAGILISIFGCLNGNILTMTRVPYAMATREAFPFSAIFSRLHPKYGTPFESIVFKTICASIMMIFLNPDRITDIAMFSMYLFYAFLFIGIFKIRRIYGKPATGSYAIPLYPVIPVVAFAGCLYICYSMVAGAPIDAIVSMGIAALGIPVYSWMEKKKMLALADAIANAPQVEFAATKRVDRLTEELFQMEVVMEVGAGLTTKVVGPREEEKQLS